ncbi:uncharacterized protein LOC125659813 [Ostrea edulis]|uniref:uncharacterized protein LOC125659813 n=1 Tax=Ostrea edulis TaxID=37623 RepID=UPI0020947B14|nr:uncharacterized protein LOC125659813 [Ostrea edulis]
MRRIVDQCCSILILFCLPSSLLSIQNRKPNCTFPDFLERDKLWRSATEFHDWETMYFNGDYIDIRQNDLRFEKRCEEIIDREKGKYIVVHLPKQGGVNVRPLYSCMQFLKRSDSVVQIKESNPSDFTLSMCHEQNMILKNRPIIKFPIEDNASIKCPFSGGYNLKITYKNELKCGFSVISPRLESECEEGDGVTLDFRTADCKLDDDHGLKDNLRCLASWTDRTAEHNYTFVVLANDRRFPQCMRLEGNLSDLKRATLFRDGKCVVNDRDSYSQTIEKVILEFEKMVVSNLCENEFDYCSQEPACSKYKKYCHKSCRGCQPETNVCSFPEELKGSWHTDLKSTPSVINISTYNLHLPGEGNFKCVGKANSTKENIYRLALLHIFENGCFPRMTCFEYKKASKMTLEYKFGKRVEWPLFPLDKMISETCQNKQLRKPFSIAVNGASIYTTSCQLPSDFGFKSGHIYLRDSKSQDYCIAYYEYTLTRSDKFNMVDINTTEPVNREHLCLSSEQFQDGSVFVITTSLSDRSYKCWGFMGSGQTRRIVQLSLEHCNKNSLNLLIHGHHIPVNSFIVLEKPKNVCPFYIDIATDPGRIPLPNASASHSPPPSQETTPPIYRTPPNPGSISATVNRGCPRVHFSALPILLSCILAYTFI